MKLSLDLTSRLDTKGPFPHITSKPLFNFDWQIVESNSKSVIRRGYSVPHMCCPENSRIYIA